MISSSIVQSIFTRQIPFTSPCSFPLYCFLASSFTLEYCLLRRVSSHSRYPILRSTKLLTCFHRSEGVKFELANHLETASWHISSTRDTFDSSNPEYRLWFAIKKLVYNFKEHFCFCIISLS